jgi:hypothetical protein
MLWTKAAGLQVAGRSESWVSSPVSLDEETRSVRKTNGPGGTGYSVACVSGGSSFWRRAVLPAIVAHPFFVSDWTALTGVVDVEPRLIDKDPDPDHSLVVCCHRLLLSLPSLQ